MSDIQEITENVIKDLKTERDHIQVQIALAKAEAKDEWEELEKKWSKFSKEAEVFTDIAKETAKEARDDLSILALDLKEGYQRLRKSL